MVLIAKERLKKVMTKTMTKSITKEYVAKARDDYYSGITKTMINGKATYELKGKFLDDLRKNDFSGTNEENAVEHTENFLKIVDPLDLPNEGMMGRLFEKKESRMMIMAPATLTMTWFGIMHLIMLRKKRSNMMEIGAKCLEIPAKNC
nr:hypothetical protein [Tanacetum cinerariifolium]